jgi:hypothetical protein
LSEGPDRLYIEKKDRERFYDRILSKDSPLGRHNGFKNNDIFLIAMCIGYREKCKEELEKREGYFLEKDLSTEEKCLIYALAVNEENNLEVLLNKKRIYDIAEQYAKGGISLLFNMIFGPSYGTFEKRFEANIVNALSE